MYLYEIPVRGLHVAYIVVRSDRSDKYLSLHEIRF
jgi:hypothetical protein